MRFLGARNSLLAFGLSMLLVGIVAPSAQAQSTGVYATICSGASTITLNEPVNDSTVTQADVTVSGSVAQANLIEVYIDDQYDSSLQLIPGQSTYETQVQFPPGTHTIRVEAINSCAGANGKASSVVTHTLPPSQPSVGGEASTGVTSTGSSGGVTVGPQAAGSQLQSTSEYPFGLPPSIGKPFDTTLRWLNVAPFDADDSVPSLSFARAASLTLGLYLLLFGMASSVLQFLSQTALLKAATSQAFLQSHRQILRWLPRFIGLMIVLAALFL